MTRKQGSDPATIRSEGMVRELLRTRVTRFVKDGRRGGTAALEFVFVLPVLFVIVIGATDLGRVVHVENVISNAARVGAAYGATHQFTEYTYESWQSEAEECARQEAAHLPAYDANLLWVNIEAEDDSDGSRRVRVDVTYPFELVIDWPGWPGQITISRYVTMRAHR